MKMKAVVIYEAGGPEQLKVETREIPELKEGWTLVKIKGFGINRSEIFTREGHSPSVKFPRILGIECVGEVEETTSSNFKKGQKIVSIMGEMGRAFDGSYAEYVLLPNEQVYPVNTSLTWEELATVPETYLTTFYSGNVNRERINSMLDYIEKYKIDIKAEKIFSLDEIAEAHKYLDSSLAFGKVIVINK